MLFLYALLRPSPLTLFSLASLFASLRNSRWNVENSSKVLISCWHFSLTNFPRSTNDMKGFLALGYSLKRACLNASQSEKVTTNSGRFSQSYLSSLVGYQVDCANHLARVSCAASTSDA